MRKDNNFIIGKIKMEKWWYSTSTSETIKAKQGLQIYLLQMKLFNPPSGASDDGVFAFQAFTALRTRHDDNGEQRLKIK